MENHDKVSYFVVASLLIIFGVVGLVSCFVSQNRKTSESVLTQSLTQETQKNDIQDSVIETKNWLVYKNEKYAFEIKYPPDWSVKEHTAGELEVDVYKGNFENPDAVISVYPYGAAREGSFEELNLKPSSIKIGNLNKAVDYVLSDGTPWGAFLTFNKMPSSWNSYGFVMLRLKIDNHRVTYTRNGENVTSLILSCGIECYTADIKISAVGEVSANDRETQEEILKTLHFLNYDFNPVVGLIK